jgi:enoyl-CoA hydratase/carnithine racemase
MQHSDIGTTVKANGNASHAITGRPPAPVLSQIIKSTAVLTLNRPERLNALSSEIIQWLQEMFDEIEADPDIRSVIITGAGERAFSAGADIKELIPKLKSEPARAARSFTQRGQALTRRIENFQKPIIVAVNGLALGGGCEVTEAAHLAIASERASFSKPEITLGFPPPFGGTQRLTRLIGRKRALALILTGTTINAEAALNIGLVNRVVPHGDLMTEALELSHQIAKNDSAAVAACLFTVTRGINLAIDEGLALEAAEFERAAVGDVVRARLDAFVQRTLGR